MARCLPAPDRPLPAASRPHRHRARAARARPGRAAGSGGNGGIGRRRDGVPHQRGIDPARTGHRTDRRRTARAVRPPLQNSCAARLDVSDRRCCAPPRAAAGRHGRVVRALRGRRAAGAGGGRTGDRSAGTAAARADRGGVAGADRRGARGAAQRRLRPGRRGLVRGDRRLCARGARVPAPARVAAPAQRLRPTPQTLGAIVAVLRKVASAPSGDRAWTRPSRSTQLQHAAIAQASVVIGYVDPAGVATQRVVAPINVRGGQLTAFDPASGRVREFAIHRVTSVVSAEPDNGWMIIETANDRRPPDRAVRQDAAARGRPRAGR